MVFQCLSSRSGQSSGLAQKILLDGAEAVILTDLFTQQAHSYLDGLDDAVLTPIIRSGVWPRYGHRFLIGSWVCDGTRLISPDPIMLHLPTGEGLGNVIGTINAHTVFMRDILRDTVWGNRAVSCSHLYAAELLSSAHAHTDTNDDTDCDLILRSVMNLTGPHTVTVPDGSATLPFSIECNDSDLEINPLFKNYGPIDLLHQRGLTFTPQMRTGLVFATDDPLRKPVLNPLLHSEPDRATHPFAPVYRLQVLSLAMNT